MTLSKSKIKDKVKDSKSEKDFKYKRFKHSPEDVDCLHCKYNEREKSLKDKIKEMSDNETTKDEKGATHTIKSLTVSRGRYDDVIGWLMEWQ